MNKAILSDLNYIFKTSIAAVLPENLIRSSLKYNFITKQLTVANKVYYLKNKNLYVVGTGKAVQNMANEVETIFSSDIKQGIISIPLGSFNHKSKNNNVTYYEGAKNNLPDENTLKTAIKIKDLASKLTENDILLVLISGGGSALLPLPKSPISLDEKCELIKKLANSGADIKELNIVRKRISELKGGQLAMHAYPATTISLILSDIVGDPLDLIASSPTCENCDDQSKVLNILNKYNLYKGLSESIKTVLSHNNEYTFPKDNVQNVMIGSNKLSIEAGMLEAKNMNYFPISLSNTVDGNVREISAEYVKLVKIIVDLKNGKLDDSKFLEVLKSLNIPGLQCSDMDYKVINNIKRENVCIILGGETTVEVKGQGLGGRNQQLALEFSKRINEFKDQMQGYEIGFLSAGTDGIDGPTDAAGAVGYVNLISDAKNMNINVEEHLLNNDSYHFYKKFMNGQLHVITGHTNTNVMDIHLIIIKQSN